MTKPNLTACLIEYVMTNRIPIPRQEIAAELEQLAKHGAQWPKCTYRQWMDAIGEMIRSGQLVVAGKSELISIPPPPEPSPNDEREKREPIKQLEMELN